MAVGLLLLGGGMGAALAWWAARAQLHAETETRVLQAHAALQVELAQIKERLHAAEADRQNAAVQRAALQCQADTWRDALDEARDECAQLSERTLRLLPLQDEVARSAELFRLTQDEVLRLSSSEAQKAQSVRSLGDQVAQLESVRNELQTRLSAATNELSRSQAERAELAARLEAERLASHEKLHLLLQAKETLADQFKSLASDILEEKSKRFAEQNQHSLAQLLEPLKSRLTAFQGKVEEVYVQEGKDRSALSQQVRQLVELNQALSLDAKNLTEALKGSAKTQGNWGELILERVLEASGLRKGEEYHVQHSHLREDGSRAQPDVVIHLPEERRLVVDAKVSLVAYERSITAHTDEDRALGVRQHLESVRAHIKGLSDKKYEALYGLKSLDFVLMFVPIEPAFMQALAHDEELFMDAWHRNVLMVSPSTLLFVVRTVAHLWRQEAQTRNAQEIARRGADLYDKLCGFVDDLQGVGMRLTQAQASFEAAQRKLSSGRGNLIRQADLLRDLGVKPSKALPTELLEDAKLQDELFVPLQRGATCVATSEAAADGTPDALGAGLLSTMPLPASLTGLD